MNTPVFGQIPKSPILAEASPESLSLLFSRDPEGYSKQDLSKIIEVLREQRARFAKAEAEAQATGKKRGAKAPTVAPLASLTVDSSPDDMGL